MRFLFIVLLLPLMTSNVFSQNTLYDGFFTPEAIMVKMQQPEQIQPSQYALGTQEYIVTLNPGSCDKILKARNYRVIFNIDAKGIETGDAIPVESDREIGIKSKVVKDPQDNGNMEITISWNLLKDTGNVKVTPVMYPADESKFIWTGQNTYDPIYLKDKGKIILMAMPNGKLVVERIVDEECPDKTGSVSVTIKDFSVRK